MTERRQSSRIRRRRGRGRGDEALVDDVEVAGRRLWVGEATGVGGQRGGGIGDGDAGASVGVGPGARSDPDGNRGERGEWGSGWIRVFGSGDGLSRPGGGPAGHSATRPTGPRPSRRGRG